MPYTDRLNEHRCTNLVYYVFGLELLTTAVVQVRPRRTVASASGWLPGNLFRKRRSIHRHRSIHTSTQEQTHFHDGTSFLPRPA